MPEITVQGGSSLFFTEPVTAFQVAREIDTELAKKALGCLVNGRLSDLMTPINEDCSLQFITPDLEAGFHDTNALWLLRHSTAHVMAEAIQEIIPGTKLAYGPPVENGFYYDMATPQNRPISSHDFSAIEEKMREIIAQDRPFVRREYDAQEGLRIVKAEGNPYKLDNANRALERNPNGSLTFYATGESATSWQDLCEGPHLPSTGRIGAVKILSLAASHLHGDASQDRLTRVYGAAYFTQQQLTDYLQQLEEAQKRDHRVVGKRMGLFHLDEQVGQGLVLWKPDGAIVRQALQEFIMELLRKQRYQQVFTPHIGRLALYRTSGHFPYYQDSQYPPIVARETLSLLVKENAPCSELSNRLQLGEIEGFLLKPMNCPHHIRIYTSEPRSYRDLPLRLSEFGTVYRWEQSGELSGMTRVRGFTQDDAHIFCTPDSVPEELLFCLALVRTVFKTLGFKDYRVRVGLRDQDSNKFIGDPEQWEVAEQACKQAASTLGVSWTEEAGEAAFYGPKVDFVVKDVIGREWQLGTVQVDYNLPERFELAFIDRDGKKKRPVMIHRAPLGSMERFVGILIEQFNGAFPTWLAPLQVSVLPVSRKSLGYANRVFEALMEVGIRARVDESDEKIGAKIRLAAQNKIPYMLIVGPRDAAQGHVSIRLRGEQKDLGAMPLERFINAIADEVRVRSLSSHFEQLPV